MWFKGYLSYQNGNSSRKSSRLPIPGFTYPKFPPPLPKFWRQESRRMVSLRTLNFSPNFDTRSQGYVVYGSPPPPNRRFLNKNPPITTGKKAQIRSKDGKGSKFEEGNFGIEGPRLRSWVGIFRGEGEKNQNGVKKGLTFCRGDHTINPQPCDPFSVFP